MKKTIYTLLIMIMTSLNIAARNCEVLVEKFNTVEVNVNTTMKLVKSDSCGVIIPSIEDKKYLDLKVVDNTLKVSYKKSYYRDVIARPVRITLLIPDTVKIVTTREYTTVKKTND